MAGPHKAMRDQRRVGAVGTYAGDKVYPCGGHDAYGRTCDRLVIYDGSPGRQYRHLPKSARVRPL